MFNIDYGTLIDNLVRGVPPPTQPISLTNSPVLMNLLQPQVNAAALGQLLSMLPQLQQIPGQVSQLQQMPGQLQQIPSSQLQQVPLSQMPMHPGQMSIQQGMPHQPIPQMQQSSNYNPYPPTDNQQNQQLRELAQLLSKNQRK